MNSVKVGAEYNGFSITEICFNTCYGISKCAYAIFESSDMTLELKFQEKNGCSIVSGEREKNGPQGI